MAKLIKTEFEKIIMKPIFKSIIEERRKEWKDYLLTKLNPKRENELHKFIKDTIIFYLYYTKGLGELRKRLRRIIYFMELQIPNIPQTRKEDFNVNQLKEFEDILKDARLKLQKSRKSLEKKT